MSIKATTYAPPLDYLLTLGCPGCPDGGDKPWRNEPFADYAAMGIGLEHVTELRRMAFDMSLDLQHSPHCYGPVHAARALATLLPPQMLPDLIELTRRLDRLNYDIWLEDMPAILARFGESAITPLARVAGDARESFGARLFLLDAIQRIAQAQPETRDRVVNIFSELLKYASYADPAINGHIISLLISLNAVEALPVIRSAFKNGHVDEPCCGPLEDVEHEIKLTPRERTAYAREQADQYEAELEEGLEGLSEHEALTVKFERIKDRTSKP